MAKTREQKEKVVARLQEMFAESKSAVFANFTGLKVNQFEDLRAKCRQENVKCLVVKKSILLKALDQAGLQSQIETKDFANGVAVLFGQEDEVAPAKIAADFGKSYEAVALFGGYLFSDQKSMDKQSTVALAKLPSKQELYAKIVGSINAPISGFVNVLSGNLRGLVNVLKAIQDQKA